jgi:hypothetical protein
MKNKLCRIIAIIFVIVFLTVGCSGKNQAGGGTRGVSSSLRASPVTDFSYDLTEDGRGY